MARKQDQELEQELERTTRIRGFRFGLHDFLAGAWGVEALRAHNDDHRSYSKKPEGIIDLKNRELLKVAAQSVAGSPIPLIQCHMHAAHKAGASPEEVWEVLELVAGSMGGRGAYAMEAWRLTFRPDLPTILRVVEFQ